jgi:hypothetical protein
VKWPASKGMSVSSGTSSSVQHIFAIHAATRPNPSTTQANSSRSCSDATMDQRNAHITSVAASGCMPGSRQGGNVGITPNLQPGNPPSSTAQLTQNHGTNAGMLSEAQISRLNLVGSYLAVAIGLGIGIYQSFMAYMANQLATIALCLQYPNDPVSYYHSLSAIVWTFELYSD